MITLKNIVRHELTGMDVRVLKAQNQYLEGIAGIVLEETMNLVIIRTGSGVKRIAKKGAVFRFTLPSGMCVDLTGSVLVMAPEKRINMRMKK